MKPQKVLRRRKPRNVRRISLGISPGFDLYLAENDGLFRDKEDLQRAFRIAVEEGMAALIEDMKAQNSRDIALRLDAVDGSRRMLEYERTMEETDLRLVEFEQA